MEKENCGSTQTPSWDKYFNTLHDALRQNGVKNIPRTRVVILSGTDVDTKDSCVIKTVLSEHTLRNIERWKEDIDKASHLQSSPETNTMKFIVLDLGKYFRDF